jgi:N-carbamoylputrescine amidase
VTAVRLAAAAAHFGRDLEFDLRRVAKIIADARAAGASLLVLPDAALGGYVDDLRRPGLDALPPALPPDHPVLARVAELAGDLVVCVGYCEADGNDRYNSAVCVTGDGVLGRHRKVHQPLHEGVSYAAGDRFEAFDTPVGRLGMMICYDKAFPEAARTLALDGAQIVACLSAWPAARTNPAPDLAQDRWTRRFDLFDRARALENQVVWVSANQAGRFGSLRFVASAKVVDPGGDVLASTGTAAGLALARLDVAAALASARQAMGHLRDRRPDAYTRTDRAVGGPRAMT